jgi:nickel/cobalt transporter (NicO) family protein
LKHFLRLVIVAGLALAGLFAAAPAWAHPLGNFTVNLYSGLLVEPGRLRVAYVVDMAEIPAFQEMQQIDADRDGAASLAERARYAARTARVLVGGLSAKDRGRPIPLRILSSSLQFRPGQAGLKTIRLEATFAGPIDRTAEIEFRDRNFSDRIGWREITAVRLGGEKLLRSSVPAVSATDRLLRYPADLLSRPLRVMNARLTVQPGPSGPLVPSRSEPGSPVGGAAFAALATWSGLSFPVLLAALLLAAGLGAAHALLPGHGKTLVAAYLVGAGGKVRHAFAVGGAVAFMHTISVLGVGLLILIVGRVLPPERIYPWLTIVSGAVVLALGSGLLIIRLRARQITHIHGHTHPPAEISRSGLAALALSGGILPSPTALLVLLSTAAAHRLVFGLSLILAFSAGLAVALVGVGVLVLRARAFVLPRLNHGLTRVMPVASAAAITAFGLYLAGKGLAGLWAV